MTFRDSPPLIKDYINYIRTVKGKSDKTADNYFRDLHLFFRFIKFHKGLVDHVEKIEDVDISDIDYNLLKSITFDDVNEFIYYLHSERNNNEKSRARRISTLRSFFKFYTVNKAVISINPIEELESPKIRKTLPKYLSLEESVKLLNSVDGKYKERNYAIITLFLNCGLRLSELCAININDLNFEENVFKVRGKGNKERIVYLNDACVNALKDYLKIRLNMTTKEKEALFISRNDRRISQRSVELMVENTLKKAGLSGQGYTVHKLRHTAATLMYQHGNVDIRVLQQVLGHENLGTTEIYTHLSNSQLKKASEANPLSKIKK
ncbi:MAG: site-specific tyrosine recombinase/integron integrase [Acutalibacteraceae bacterium]